MADLTVRCEKCGEELPADFTTDSYRHACLEVEPCEKCLEKARDEGWDKGHEDGKAEVG